MQCHNLHATIGLVHNVSRFAQLPTQNRKRPEPEKEILATNKFIPQKFTKVLSYAKEIEFAPLSQVIDPEVPIDSKEL